ncbi:MAG: NADH-dependent FMN reductase [Nitrosopumilaceae archaeon]|nr:NAD(P)H-dependent oxidoreductase [Nitrosopumilaceae archaeon]NIU00826.1 NAD(P)H-dependent oxidoreductase [Nitrosopumilaceae archaeon]NIU87279.1 NADH-dependent FMN reductase [Nitrosopumilaceae archaeon]NIV65807.1 NADH-dependent FMN reductase [Nitrosopumilaceae archaeon]NIX61428.1 NADH-dependent FMN reductase [Nitrosopumilaceae archaeon]
MKIVVISGSPRKAAKTQIMMKYVYDYVKSKNDNTVFINLSQQEVDCFRGHEENYNEATKKARNDITEADVWLIGSPIYNSFFSSALKNLFEYIDYKKTEGKVAGMAILAAGNIGFIFVQTLMTQLMSYFKVLTNPKGVFLTTNDIDDHEINDKSKERLRNMVNETLKIADKVRT